MSKASSLVAIQYIVNKATQLGMSKGLWTILITKYLYLLDYYSAKHTGKTVTEIEWKMWNYGPWNAAIPSLIEDALNDRLIYSQGVLRNTPSENDSYVSFYGDSARFDEQSLDNLLRSLTDNTMVRMAISGAIKKYGQDSKALLTYVYHDTEPVARSTKGEILSFDNLLPFPKKAFEEPQIGKKTAKKGTALLEKLRSHKGLSYNPPVGQFDEVYQKEILLFDETHDDKEESVKLIGRLDDIKFGSH